MTISLVTYRPGQWLEPCLDSVLSQTYSRLEIVVLDNGGDAPTARALRSITRGRSDVKLIFSTENLGYARAHNGVISSAGGEFVCLLNQDMVLDTSFVEAAVAAFDSADVGAVQGRLRWLSPQLARTDLIDSTGLSMSRSRRITSRGQGSVDGPHNDTSGLIFGADGACPIYRRTALEDVRVDLDGRREFLDETFFMYKEDVDLAWRLLLRGWKTRYEPEAVAWHARGAGESSARTPWEVVKHRRHIPVWVKRLSWRNQRLMQVKNEDLALLMRDAPRIVVRELAALAYLLVSDPRNLGAVIDLVRLLPSAVRKRRIVQRRRTVDRGELASWFT